MDFFIVYDKNFFIFSIKFSVRNKILMCIVFDGFYFLWIFFIFSFFCFFTFFICFLYLFSFIRCFVFILDISFFIRLFFLFVVISRLVNFWRMILDIRFFLRCILLVSCNIEIIRYIVDSIFLWINVYLFNSFESMSIIYFL